MAFLHYYPLFLVFITFPLLAQQSRIPRLLFNNIPKISESVPDTGLSQSINPSFSLLNISLDYETCKQGKSDFLKFLGKAMAVMNSPDVITQNSGFCFKSLQYSYQMLSSNSMKINVVASDPIDWYCSDVHILVAGSQWTYGNVYFKGNHSYLFSDLTDEDLAVIEARGVHAYESCDSAMEILPDILKTIELFTTEIMAKGDKPSAPKEWVKQLNYDFSKNLTGYEWQPRDKVKRFIPDESMINSGDIFQLMSFGGIGPLLQYGLGGRTSHVVMALWDTEKLNGKKKLYIVESRDGKDWPSNGIQKSPYRVWIDNITLEESSAVWLPLRKDLADKFEVEKAWEHFSTLEGTLYGYPNILLSWLDTVDGNLPPLLDFNFVYSAFMLLEKYTNIDIVSEIMGEALSVRLIGKPGLNYREIVIEAHKQGKTIMELIAITEKDDYDYNIGKSYVCSTLATSLWKAGGLFGDLEIMPHEFTPKDTYQIKFFQSGENRPEECKKNDPEL